MAQYTLAAAAQATGKSKSTILRSIRAGRISAVRDALTGGWLVEPAELHRLYAERDAARGAPDDRARNGHDAPEMAELRARLADAQDQIGDLRRRLDVTTGQLGEALQQVRALTDQRAAPAPIRRWWRFGR